MTLMADPQKGIALHSNGETPPRLSEFQEEVISVFVQLSRLLGQPKSIGEVYGLLFISEKPLALDDLMTQLLLSKGAASQALKYLRKLGAVRNVYVSGDRRDHYEAVAELRTLVTRFIEEHVTPHFDVGSARLDRIESLLKDMPPGERQLAASRIGLLRSWTKTGKRFLPVLTGVLGK